MQVKMWIMLMRQRGYMNLREHRRIPNSGAPQLPDHCGSTLIAKATEYRFAYTRYSNQVSKLGLAAWIRIGTKSQGCEILVKRLGEQVLTKPSALGLLYKPLISRCSRFIFRLQGRVLSISSKPIYRIRIPQSCRQGHTTNGVTWYYLPKIKSQANRLSNMSLALFFWW